jgi:putative endonuclease
MYYVYALTSNKPNWIYVGSTDNLKRRIAEHSRGKCQSTRPYLPVTLDAYIAVKDEMRARKLEKYLKTGSGKVILKKRILSDEVLT